jgi:chromosomal replication initiation ATPase DnaA
MINYNTKLLNDKYGGNAKEIIKHLEKAENEIKLFNRCCEITQIIAIEKGLTVNAIRTVRRMRKESSARFVTMYLLRDMGFPIVFIMRFFNLKYESAMRFVNGHVHNLLFSDKQFKKEFENIKEKLLLR